MGIWQRIKSWVVSLFQKRSAPVPEPLPVPPPIQETGEIKQPASGAAVYKCLPKPASLPEYRGKTYELLKERYAYLYQTAGVTNRGRTEWAVAYVIKNKERYQAAERMTGVPWVLIACIHGLEASFNFKTYLGNGDPLGQVTRHVPAGRGPFGSWEEGAMDALTYDGLTAVKNWTLEMMLWKAENYNGLGYYAKGINSPYLWSCTQHHTRGKYVADHVFDPNAKDDQVGVAAVFKRLEEMGVISFAA